MSLFSIFVLTSLITLSGAQESSSHNVGQNVSEQVNSPTNENGIFEIIFKIKSN